MIATGRRTAAAWFARGIQCVAPAGAQPRALAHAAARLAALDGAISKRSAASRPAVPRFPFLPLQEQP